MYVGHSRGAGVAGVDMDYGSPAAAGLHYKAKGNRMALGHIRAHNQDTVGVGQVPLGRGRGSPPKRSAQPGHRGAVSDPGLVLDPDHPQTARKKFLDEIVLLVVQCCAAERGYSWRVLDYLTFVVALPPGLIPGLFY